jgi:hypothetical protein
MPRLGLGIHEFACGAIRYVETSSWIPKPSYGMTAELND